jgi:adenylate kinase family enzyme
MSDRNSMKKILVIGSGGAGKSTLSRQLGEVLGLPVIHLDSEYWNAGWEPTPKAKWQQTVEHLITQDAWVMDGNYGGTLDLRLEAADTVIFLNMPRLLCLWRVVKRRWQYAGKTRPDMASDCPEQLNWEFLNWVWTYPTRRRSTILNKLANLPPDKTVVILRSPAEVKQFLRRLNNAH